MEYIFTLQLPTAAVIVIAVLVAVIAFVAALMILPPSTLKISVSNDSIAVKAVLAPGVHVDRGEVVKCFVANLAVNQEFKPKLKINGWALPGFRLGWFRLENGAKAYLALNDPNSDAVILETSRGSYIILQPQDFTKFTSILKSLGWLKQEYGG